MLKILSSATLLLASFVTHADIKDAPLDFTQPPSIYNADYVDIVGEETREHEDLKREYSLAIEPKYKSKRNRMASQPQVLSKTASQVATETGCPNLAIGGGTLVAFNTEGSSYCVSTVVDAETKIEGLMLNIPSTVNYDLFFFKYEDDGQFTLIDSSVSPNSTSEQTVAKAEAGAYVLFAQATQGSSGDPVTLGWLGYNNFDQYEANDKFGQSTSLQTNAVIQGNLDNTNDLDFFSYTVGPDQSLLSLRFSASEQFSFEIWNGAAWVQLAKNQLNTYNVTPGSTINLLVRSAAGNPPPASAQYSLGVHNPGSAESVTGFKAWNNENLTKLLVQSGRPDDVMNELKTASIEAHDRISFSGTVKDSDNNPVPLTSVRVDVWTNGSGVLEPQTLLADENGYFNGSVSLKGDECSAIETFNVHNRVHSGTPTNPSEWWDISYGVGRYIVSLPNATTVSENYFIHICQEKLTKMCYYERDYNTGGSKWTCL